MDTISNTGRLRDEEVAARTGHTRQAVTLRRRALGLPMPDSKIYRWKPEHDTLLGKLPDRELADQIGCPLTSVEQRRLLHLPAAPRPTPKSRLT